MSRDAYIYFEDKHTQLWCGRAEDVLSRITHVDLLCTDPPYGISHPVNYRSRGRGKLAACRDYIAVQGDDRPFDPAILLALKIPTILWGGNHYASRLPDSGGWLVWDKERPDGLDQSTCELAWTNCVKGVRRFRYLWNGAMRAGNETLIHPMQKPVALMKWCLSFMPSVSVVADCYAGSGSLLRAAKDLGIKAIGCELEEHYCERIVERLAQQPLPFAPPAVEAITTARLFTEE